MRSIRSTPFSSAAAQRNLANAGAIEWEELPSLAKRLVNRGGDARGPASSGFDSTWGETKPAVLDPAPVSEPFVESLDGLATREVIEPDVFTHFFGPNAEE